MLKFNKKLESVIQNVILTHSEGLLGRILCGEGSFSPRLLLSRLPVATPEGEQMGEITLKWSERYFITLKKYLFSLESFRVGLLFWLRLICQ